MSGEAATDGREQAPPGLPADTPGVTPPSHRDFEGTFVTDVIVEMGFARREDVGEALDMSRHVAKSPEQCLLDLGAIDERRLSMALAERNGLDHVDLDRFEVDRSAAALVGRSIAARYTALPIAIAPDGSLVVAFEDPYDLLGQRDIEVVTKSEVRPVVAAGSQIRALIDQLPERTAPGAEPELESMPEPETSRDPEPAPETETSRHPEPAPEPAASPDPEPAPGPTSHREPEPMPDPNPHPGPVPVPEPTPHREPEPTPPRIPEPTPDPVPTPGPVPVPEPGPEPVPEPGPEPVPEPQPVREPGPEPVPEPGPVRVPEPQPVREPEPGPRPVPDPEPEPPEVPPLPAAAEGSGDISRTISALLETARQATSLAEEAEARIAEQSDAEARARTLERELTQARDRIDALERRLTQVATAADAVRTATAELISLTDRSP